MDLLRVVLQETASTAQCCAVRIFLFIGWKNLLIVSRVITINPTSYKRTSTFTGIAWFVVVVVVHDRTLCLAFWH